MADSGYAIVGAPIFVTHGICTTRDMKGLIKTAFSGFPSGHVIYVCAGQIYITLWLCSSYGYSPPKIKPRPKSKAVRQQPSTLFGRVTTILSRGILPAAPGIWQSVHISIPLLVALYTSMTRISDYKHSASAVYISAICGAFFGWLGFRLYHPSINSGYRGPWGPREDKPGRWAGRFARHGASVEHEPSSQQSELGNGELETVEEADEQDEEEQSTVRRHRDEEEGLSHARSQSAPNNRTSPNRRGHTWG